MTTPEGAKGWVDRTGSAQVPAGGHGLDVAPDAQPDGVRVDARCENDGVGGEPSNAPVAAAPTIVEVYYELREEYDALGMLSYHGQPWGLAPDLSKDDIEKIRALLRRTGAAIEGLS
jgi:hypothetical protein